jgi:ribonucleoside-triphosphate reductase
MGDKLNNSLDTILVRKKNGNLEPFDLEKIAEAAKKAFLNVGYVEEEAETEAWIVATDVERELVGRCVNEINREDIHDAVQIAMMSRNKQAAVAYITYRTNRRLNHGTLDTLISAVKNITVETTRDNANVGNSPAGRMAQIASEANKHYALNYVLPKDIAQAHIDGRIHIHKQHCGIR